MRTGGSIGTYEITTSKSAPTTSPEFSASVANPWARSIVYASPGDNCRTLLLGTIIRVALDWPCNATLFPLGARIVIFPSPSAQSTANTGKMPLFVIVTAFEKNRVSSIATGSDTVNRGKKDDSVTAIP